MATLSTDTDSIWDSVFSAQILPQDSPGTPKLPQWPSRNNGPTGVGKRERDKAVVTVRNPRMAASDVGVSRGHG